ncbi:MAG: hypothetical protein ACOY4K_07880 [Pseudomonadota bacterium]
MTHAGLTAEWRYSAGYVAATAACCLFLGLLSVGSFFLSPGKAAVWVFPAIGVLLGAMAVGSLLHVLTLRVRLFSDRVEKSGLLGTRALPRRDIAGRRRLPDGDFLIVPKAGQGRAVQLPQRVMRVAGILAWLETLDDLDVKDAEKATAELEADDRLGSTVAARRDALVWLRRIANVLNLAGFAIGLWALLLPKPFAVIAALCVVGPVIAFLFAGIRPDAVRLMSDNQDGPAAGLVGLWLMPPIATALLGLGYDLVDWQAPLIAAIAPAVLFVVASMLIDRRMRNVLGAVFALALGYAWGWGGLVVANALFDQAPPSLVSGTVTDASLPTDRNLTVTVTSPALSHPVASIDVPLETLKALPAGTKTCLLMFPGRLGWRYAFLALCPPAPRESTELVLPPAGSRYRHARPPPPRGETRGR